MHWVYSTKRLRYLPTTNVVKTIYYWDRSSYLQPNQKGRRTRLASSLTYLDQTYTPKNSFCVPLWLNISIEWYGSLFVSTCMPLENNIHKILSNIVIQGIDNDFCYILFSGLIRQNLNLKYFSRLLLRSKFTFLKSICIEYEKYIYNAQAKTGEIELSCLIQKW